MQDVQPKLTIWYGCYSEMKDSSYDLFYQETPTRYMTQIYPITVQGLNNAELSSDKQKD